MTIPAEPKPASRVAIGLVAHDSEVLLLNAGRVGGADDNDPPVRSQGGVVRLVPGAAEVSGDNSVCAEAVVEVAAASWRVSAKSVPLPRFATPP